MSSFTIEWAAVGAFWLRDMKRFLRARSRLVGTMVVPILLFAYLGLGLNSLIIGSSGGPTYASYILPGIVGMSVLLSSMSSGISVLWDRELGFLREIMVAPVSRLSIVLGRIIGGTTISLMQVLIIAMVAAATGFRPVSVRLLPVALCLVVLSSVGFIGLGLAFASRLRDTQGFNMVMSLLVLPMLLLSGALFPLEASPELLRALSLVDPLTYTVDGLRWCLIGESSFTLVLSVGVVGAFAACSVTLGTWMFHHSETG